MSRRPSGLIIPPNGSVLDYERKEIFFCAVCAPLRHDRGDRPLGFSKSEAEQYQRHVVRCSAEHEEELLERSLRNQAPGIFGREGWDGEMEQWVRDNKQALLEGRKKL